MSQAPATFSMDVSHYQDRLVITLAGALDAVRAPLLGQVLAAALEADEKSVIIDLRDVEAIDASGVTVLMSADRLLRRCGGSVLAIDASPAVEETIRQLRRRPAVPIFRTSALAADGVFGGARL